MEHATIILVIFAVTYIAIAVGRVPGLKLNRPGIALLGAISMMILGGTTTAQAVSYVNWPTVFLLFGFFVISAQLRLSGFYDKVAAGFADQLGHPARFLLILMVVTGGLSAFLNHDIVCFVFAPIVGVALLRRQINPVPFLIALAISSNIGAAATLIGNPQNMMIGEVAKLNFGGYMLWSSAPVIVAMGATYGIIWFMSRNNLHASPPDQNVLVQQEYPFNRMHTIKGISILVVVIGMFFTSMPKEVIALAAAGIHLASPKFRTDDLLGLVDWPILVLFMGLFVVAGAFQSTGQGEAAVHRLAQGGFNLSTPFNLTLTTSGGLRPGAGQQLWRQPHRHRQRVQHHRRPAGACDGDKNLLLGLRPAGNSRDAGGAGGIARVGLPDESIKSELLCRNDDRGKCQRGVSPSSGLRSPSPPPGEKAGMRGRSQSAGVFKF